MSAATATRLHRRGFMLAVGALLAASLPSHGHAQDSPETAQDFLESIYAAYRNNGAGIDRSDDAVLNRYFTPELAGIISDDDARAAADGEVPNLDADPFIDAQDGDIGDITVTVSDAPGGRMMGHAAFTNSGEQKAIDLVLVETPAGWRIDDILWPEGTLRGLYSH
ncbi:MAG TPA: hypothetical protein VNX29_08200 [Kaistia sp.]|nr:hypothetical protein [Kaistia sp.]